MTDFTADSADALVSALRKAKGRDTITVSGQFGAVTLKDFRPETAVTIRATKPGAAHFERIDIRGCSNLTLTGLSCWPLGPVPAAKAKQYLINADPSSSGIEVTDSIFRGRADSDNHPRWSLADWQAAKIGAVLLRGPKGVIRNCAAIGVQFGYGVSGASSEIFGNLVYGFSGDGLRATDDNCVIIGNRITDAMQIDQNHSDGFQAFKTSGLLNGLVVKDNVLIEWTARPDNPLRAKMQGISLHNGPYANVVVRDNSVSTSAPNGIRLHAVRNLTVTGNRVRNVDGKRGNHPWIHLINCTGEVVVENNQAEMFKLPRGVRGRANIEPDYSVRY